MQVPNFQCFDINIWNVLCRQILLKSFYNKSSLPFIILIVLQEHYIRYWELAQHGVIIGLIERERGEEEEEKEKKKKKDTKNILFTPSKISFIYFNINFLY